jgi:cytochrome d ubiquinol oxidase subunit I
MALAFWGFRIMWYAAIVMFGTLFYATIQRFRRQLWTSRRFHRFLIWSTPVGILAIQAGWVLAESGRQPWVVFGQLRTSDAVSQLAPGDIVFSVVGFALLYALMLGAYIAYIVRTLRIGPERDHPQWDAQAQADDGALVPGVNGAVFANGNVRV